MSDHLPVTLAALHRDATTASDRVEMFRTYVKLLNHAYKALEKARKEAENADRRLGELRVDHTFFLRHRARVETAFRSEERRVGKECVIRVDLGGRRIIKKKK